VALPLFDEEIFQKIPVVGRAGPTARPDPPARPSPPARPNTPAWPDKSVLPAATTGRSGTVAARPDSAAAAAATPPAFSPRLVRVEKELIGVLTTSAKPAAAAVKKSVADLVEVYDYYAANQLQFSDDNANDAIDVDNNNNDDHLVRRLNTF
jgi:hypothetical protein